MAPLKLTWMQPKQQQQQQCAINRETKNNMDPRLISITTQVERIKMEFSFLTPKMFYLIKHIKNTLHWYKDFNASVNVSFRSSLHNKHI